VVGDSRNICHWALIILVTPLHRPGSANAAASVCLYKEKERPLRCRPIIRPHPTAGLWFSCTQGPVGNRVPRRVPSLRFDRCAMAPQTWPLEHSNSGEKKVSIRFDSILATESIFSIRFGNLINLPLVHRYSNSKLGVIFVVCIA